MSKTKKNAIHKIFSKKLSESLSKKLTMVPPCITFFLSRY